MLVTTKFVFIGAGGGGLELLEKSKIPEAHGYGEEKPIADNTTNEGRAANRRVEFKILDEDTGPPKPKTHVQPTDEPSRDEGDVDK